jgi:hypothetical protein
VQVSLDRRIVLTQYFKQRRALEISEKEGAVGDHREEVGQATQ